jgi:hypothetical protein
MDRAVTTLILGVPFIIAAGMACFSHGQPDPICPNYWFGDDIGGWMIYLAPAVVAASQL